MQQYDDQKLDKIETGEKGQMGGRGQSSEERGRSRRRPKRRCSRRAAIEELIGDELDGLHLRTANWKIVPTGDKDVAQFRYMLPDKGLEITKTYRLAPVPARIAEGRELSGVSS